LGATSDQEGGPEAFGRAFEGLMKRLDRQCEPLLGRRYSGQPAIRQYIGLAFATELEDLIARHGVHEAIAEYVRHVLREGFDVAFDLMDPTDEAVRLKQTEPRSDTPGWPGSGSGSALTGQPDL
jgi:hypothetical protein